MMAFKERETTHMYVDPLIVKAERFVVGAESLWLQHLFEKGELEVIKKQIQKDKDELEAIRLEAQRRIDNLQSVGPSRQTLTTQSPKPPQEQPSLTPEYLLFLAILISAQPICKLSILLYEKIRG